MQDVERDAVERVARALCELHIRNVRRHDTEQDKLNAMLPNAVDLLWHEHIPEAIAAISAMTPDIWNAAIEAAAEACQSHPEEGSEDLGPGIALAIEIIRALMSPKPPIL